MNDLIKQNLMYTQNNFLNYADQQIINIERGSAIQGSYFEASNMINEFRNNAIKYSNFIASFAGVIEDITIDPDGIGAKIDEYQNLLGDYELNVAPSDLVPEVSLLYHGYINSLIYFIKTYGAETSEGSGVYRISITTTAGYPIVLQTESQVDEGNTYGYKNVFYIIDEYASPRVFASYRYDSNPDNPDHSKFEFAKAIIPYNTNKVSIAVTDIVSEIGKNVDYYECMAEATGVAVNNAIQNSIDNSVNGISEALLPYTSSDNESIRQFSSKLVSAYATGGALGLLTLLRDGLKSSSNISVEEDQYGNELLAFTDASAVMPKDWLSGIVSGSLTVLTTAATIIGYAINVVAGTVVSLIGALTTKLFDFFQSKLNEQTRAQITNTLGAIPVYPVPVVQQDMSASNFTSSDDRVNALFEDHIPQLMHIKGRYAVFSTDGTTLRQEWFLSCDNRVSWFRNTITGLQTPMSFGSGLVVPGTCWDWDTLKQTTWYVDNDTYKISNGSDGVLSEYDDAYLKDIFLINFLHMILKTFMHDSKSSWNFTKFWISYDGGRFAFWNDETQTIFTFTYEDFSTPEERAFMEKFGSVYYNYTGYSTSIEWEDIYDLCALFSKCQCIKYPGSDSIILFDGRMAYNNFNTIKTDVGVNYYIPASVSISPAIVPPQFSRAKLLGEIIAVGVASIAIAVSTAVASTKLRKAIRYKTAKNNAMACKAYDDFTKDPTAENYAAYMKARRKNNMWTNVFGGTKLSREGYWSAIPSSDNTTISSSASKTFYSKMTNKLTVNNSSTENTLGDVILLIRG